LHFVCRFDRVAQQNVPQRLLNLRRRLPQRSHLSSARSGEFYRDCAHQGSHQCVSDDQLGYDDSRVWAVEAIMKTSVEGISKVLVYVADKSGKQKPSAIQFFALPDASTSLPGRDSALRRESLHGSARADSEASRWSVSRLCRKGPGHPPSSRTSSARIARKPGQHGQAGYGLPKARIVYENYPLPQHAAAAGAAAYGVCVKQARR